MIDESSYVLICFNKRENGNVKSGTMLAYQYAIKQKKVIKKYNFLLIKYIQVTSWWVLLLNLREKTIWLFSNCK